MMQARGWITVVQEGRFRLVTPDGRAQLFLTSPNIGIGERELLRFASEQSMVSVRYQASESLLAGVAKEIEPVKRNAENSR